MGHPPFFSFFSQLFNDISIGHTDFKNRGERKTTAKTVTSAALSMLPLKLTTRAFSNSFLHFEKLFISHFQCCGSKRPTLLCVGNVLFMALCWRTSSVCSVRRVHQGQSASEHVQVLRGWHVLFFFFKPTFTFYCVFWCFGSSLCSLSGSLKLRGNNVIMFLIKCVADVSL